MASTNDVLEITIILVGKLDLGIKEDYAGRDT